jgi:cell division protein FtsI/penicillin-binding protein 2
MRGRARRRAVWACAFLALVFTAYSARLISLQFVRNEEFAALAAKNHTTRIPITARRGMIMDRNGEILAANMPVRRVVVDGTHVKKPRVLAAVAAPYLGVAEDELAAQLDTKSRYKVLMHELAEEKAFALMKEMSAKNLRGLYFYSNTTRTYPNGPMLSHVLGFLARKDPQDEHVSGVEGIERSLDHHLCGIEGFRHIERDRTGKEVVIYRGQEQAPRHGLNVQLTIDMGLQAILEAEMDAAFKEYRPETCTGILVDPKTGEILALSNRPNFDLNDLNSTKPEQMINRAILDVVEPGSTFKIVVAAAALNERVVNERSLIYCENGAFAYGGRILRDHHGYGQMSVHDILVKSSNIGSAKMALMMGDDKYYEYVRRFGFGQKTGVELPGETAGLLNPPSRWDKLTITRMPMGHAIAVTPLQIAMGMSVIANGGKLLRPHIVRSVRDENQQEVYRFEPEVVREVVPEKTAKFVSDALVGVVGEGGTARLAQVFGFTVAGKTGTAQKVDPKGGYTPGKYVVSFVGYLPAEEPRFVCLIMVNDAKIASNLNYGGLVAAPIFARVAEKAARYLDLTPAPKPGAILPVALRDTGENTVRR